MQVLLPKDIEFGVDLGDLGADGVGGYSQRDRLCAALVGTIMFLMVKSSDFTGCKQRFTFRGS